ncbi:MAG: hypothetical protein KatS3mg082_0224 [Nitrospiraceae bacterium]|nr:MAG: hypothetical protein KatS3mg082_0224 [Nitrospiraceae bacterium]
MTSLIQRAIEAREEGLADAKLKPSDIDEVVLVGRSDPNSQGSRVGPRIFGKEPHKGVNPDEVVAVGAAIQGGVLRANVRTSCSWT